MTGPTPRAARSRRGHTLTAHITVDADADLRDPITRAAMSTALVEQLRATPLGSTRSEADWRNCRPQPGRAAPTVPRWCSPVRPTHRRALPRSTPWPRPARRAFHPVWSTSP
jgi:hypothetical protein